jgi:hypothetical protein
VQQVVLDDVAQGADRIVEAAAALDAKSSAIVICTAETLSRSHNSASARLANRRYSSSITGSLPRK